LSPRIQHSIRRELRTAVLQVPVPNTAKKILGQKEKREYALITVACAPAANTKTLWLVGATKWENALHHRWAASLWGMAADHGARFHLRNVRRNDHVIRAV